MTGTPMKIHLNYDANPYLIYASRNVPVAWKKEVQKNISVWKNEKS